jgi:protein subunit release factor A
MTAELAQDILTKTFEIDGKQGVRVTYLPLDVTVEVTDHDSALKNLPAALRKLASVLETEHQVDIRWGL